MNPLYDHQKGAAFGYNPQKPGRPSHCHHAFCIAKLRLIIGVVVHAGNETTGIYSAEGGRGLRFSAIADFLRTITSASSSMLSQSVPCFS